MIDADEIRARALKSREVTVDVEGRSFMLRVPTMHEIQLGQRSASRLSASLGENATELVLQRLLVESAVIGWSGIMVRDVLAEEGDEPLAFAPTLVDVVLDAQPRWALLLGAELYERIVARSSAAAEDAKN